MSAVFQGKLAESLQFGHVLEIAGRAEKEATWISISLTTGKFNERDVIDIGLHMAVSFPEEAILFKQQINKKWLDIAKEEYDTGLLHEQFKVLIVLDRERFHISVNNQPILFVKYGMDVSELSTIKINGHLASITQVDHRKYFPSPWPPIQIAENRVNFSHDIPVPFVPGHVMVIMVKLNGDKKGRFIMHFRNVWNWKRQEVHVSMRFDTKKVIRTSKLPTTKKKDNPEKMVFVAEETKGTFPFEDFSRPFKLAVAFTPTHFKMAKDGVFLFDYLYKTPNVLPDIAGVKVFGIDGVSVRVSSIEHYHLDDAECEGFEDLSQRKFQ